MTFHYFGKKKDVCKGIGFSLATNEMLLDASKADSNTLGAP